MDSDLIRNLVGSILMIEKSIFKIFPKGICFLYHTFLWVICIFGLWINIVWINVQISMCWIFQFYNIPGTLIMLYHCTVPLYCIIVLSHILFLWPVESMGKIILREYWEYDWLICRKPENLDDHFVETCTLAFWSIDWYDIKSAFNWSSMSQYNWDAKITRWDCQSSLIKND